MLQKNIVCRNMADLEEKLDGLDSQLEGFEYTDGVVCAYVANTPEDEAKEMLSTIAQRYPKLKITGMSSSAYSVLLKKDRAVIFIFSFMTRSNVTLFVREFERGSKEKEETKVYAKRLSEEIKRIPDVKCIEIYFASIDPLVPEFLEELSSGMEKIPIFGSVAGVNSSKYMRDFITISHTDSIVVGGDWIGAGVSAAVYSGKDLFVYPDYLFGWKPIGRFMDVKICENNDEWTTVIGSIDGERPTDVYNRYLGVKENDYFISNICEFPLVVERNGMYIGRTPAAYGEDGEVYLSGDIRPEERVRFSYGEHDEIMSGTRNGANRMIGFEPERLSLVICGNRFNFLQDEAHLEVDYYSEGNVKEPAVVLGMGEIYKYNGRGGVLNSALVAVGMREGLGERTSYPRIHPIHRHEHNAEIPLAERLSHFLNTMTGELVEALKETKAASEAKGAFLSNMSHEIRTPINAILGMDEMILREGEDPKVLEYAQNIKTAGNTLLSLVNDILDFSKIEAKKMDIIPVDYDVSSVVNDLMHMINPRARAKGLKLDFRIDSDIPSVLYGDEIRIKQVMTNILTNAVKYTEEGSVTLQVGYRKCSEDEILFDVKVIDTGIGIKPDDLSRMFGVFQRVDEEKNRNIEGTGLGLNITRHLLELMGSELVVESEYGKGSTFGFSLRQGVKKWTPIGDYMEAYSRSLMNIEKYRERFTAETAEVLVVDDTLVNITIFEGLLKQTKVKIDRAQSGAECLEKTRQKKYDIIFLDHRMPGMDGIETLKRLKSEINNPNAQTPVVSLTANAISGAREEYMKAGFDDYLTKPIMSEKLELVMIRHLPENKVVLSADTDEPAEKEDHSLPDWLAGIAEIDTEAGLKNCGTQELYIETVTIFADVAKNNIKEIREYFETGNIKDYTTKVHALKSSSRLIGAEGLSRLAESLEKAGDDGDLERINEDTPGLLADYRSLFEKLESGLRDEGNDEELPAIDDEMLDEAIENIRELSAGFDYDSIRYILDSLKGYSMKEDRKELIDGLDSALVMANWDKMNDLLESAQGKGKNG